MDFWRPVYTTNSRILKMSLFPGELNWWRQELKICCLQVSPINILLEFYLYALEAKEEYILWLSILLTVLWMYHHLLIYINILLLSNPIHWHKHQDYKTTTMISVLSASNSIFCLGSQILSKLVVMFHTVHFLKFRSNLSIVYIISGRRMKIVCYSITISMPFYTTVQVNL